MGRQNASSLPPLPSTPLGSAQRPLLRIPNHSETPTDSQTQSTQYRPQNSPSFRRSRKGIDTDLNKDGKLDLVSANLTAGNVSVFLGTGPGTFGNATNIDTGLGCQSVVVADVNADGNPDIVTANNTAASFSVLIGSGTGSFAAANSTAITSPSAVVSGDFNLDGKPDLAFAHAVGNSVSIRLNSGSGTFPNVTTVTLPAGSTPPHLVTVDLNGDGKLDIVTANQGGDSASLLIGNGSGGFTLGPSLTTGSSPRNVVASDVNGDKLPDLVLSNGLASTLSVFVQRCL